MEEIKSPRKTVILSGGVLAALAMIMALVAAFSATPAGIMVDNRQIAAVKSEAQAEAVIADFLAEQTALADSEVYFAENVTVTADVKADTVVSYEEAMQLLAEAATPVTDGAAIVVDGKPVVYMGSTELANNALQYLKRSYLPNDSTMTVLDAKFAEEVIVEPAEAKVAELCDLNEAKLVLKGIDSGVAPISVIVVLEKTRTEEIPFKTVYKNSNKLRYGVTETKQQGVNGSREVTLQLVQTNGVETARYEMKSTTLVEAVDAVVMQGAQVQTSSRSTTYVTEAGMIWPTTAKRISSYYGTRSRGYHTGLDIDGNSGDPVWAAKDGTVLEAGYNGSYGNDIVISHGNGLKTRYSHLKSISVSAGDEVTIGQQIGTEGSTGNSTGAHLHFEVIVNGDSVNPLNYIK